ncbi:MAG: DUF4292 domain-containing protein [Bacteroidales bacterium]|nr:DUF4292 domain-containing protein [Bacteroidales bacterium]
MKIKADIMNRYVAYLMMACLLMAGCRSHKETAVEQTPPPAEPTCQYRWLTATFDCTVMGTTINGLMRTECDSVIWLSASKIIELGRARLTHDSVEVYAKIYNRYFRGNYDDVYRLTGVRTSFDELQKKIDNAYIEKKKVVTVTLKARQLNEPLTLNIRRIEALPTPLTFPFRIPESATPLQ